MAKSLDPNFAAIAAGYPTLLPLIFSAPKAIRTLPNKSPKTTLSTCRPSICSASHLARATTWPDALSALHQHSSHNGRPAPRHHVFPKKIKKSLRSCSSNLPAPSAHRPKHPPRPSPKQRSPLPLLPHHRSTSLQPRSRPTAKARNCTPMCVAEPLPSSKAT